MLYTQKGDKYMEIKELSSIIAELMKDQAVVEEAKKCKSNDDVIAFAKKHNIDASLSDIAKAVQLNLTAEEELNSNELDSVSGGYHMWSTESGSHSLCIYTG